MRYECCESLNQGDIEMTDLRFSEYFKEEIRLFGAECAWNIWVNNGGMEPWEFRFWIGFRSLT